MGAARTAPDPKFEQNLKEIGNLPEDKRGMAFATTLLTGGSGVNSIMGRASGGASMLDTQVVSLESLNHPLQPR